MKAKAKMVEKKTGEKYPSKMAKAAMKKMKK